MYSGLVLDSDCWWSFLTAGIFFPDLATLMPSPTNTGLPLKRSMPGCLNARPRQRRVSLSRFRAGLCRKSRIRS